MEDAPFIALLAHVSQPSEASEANPAKRQELEDTSPISATIEASTCVVAMSVVLGSRRRMALLDVQLRGAFRVCHDAVRYRSGAECPSKL